MAIEVPQNEEMGGREVGSAIRRRGANREGGVHIEK